MDKLVKKLDELFEKYKVADEDVAAVGELIAAINGGELKTEGEEFEAPDMGDKEYGYEEAGEDED